MTFPHRRVERPAPVIGRHFHQQERVDDTVKMASAAKGFYSNETQSFLSTFAARPSTVSPFAARPSTVAVPVVTHEPLRRMPPINTAVSALRTASPGSVRNNAAPGTPLVWGGGFGVNRRVEHLHRCQGDISSTAFSPLGLPRGAARLSESGLSRSFNTALATPRVGTHPSIFATAWGGTPQSIESRGAPRAASPPPSYLQF